jgi:glycosyltransferase involved in cell wall biosynthesis
MRILHCLDSIDPALAGPVEAARQFTIASQAIGHEVEIVCLDSEVSEWVNGWPVPIHALGGCTSYRYSAHLIPWFRQNAARFDAVIVHGVFKYHLVGAWRGLRDTGTPYFVMLHGMLNPWFQETYPLKHLKKLIFWYLLIHSSLKGAGAVLYLCEEERRLARLSFPIRPRREAIVPLGIEGAPATLKDNEFADQFPQAIGRRVILFLGRICAMKACDLLLRAFATAWIADRSALLVMAGTDSENLASGLQKLARSLGIADQVLWTGPLYEGRKWSAYQVADAFILPSHCETFPVAVLEALSSSVPVLITRKVNIYPQIERHGAGLVCDDTEDGTRQAIAKWLSMKADVRQTMRDRARQCFESEFSINGAIAKHLEVLERYALHRQLSHVS